MNSEFLKLAKNDYVKGLIVAVLTTPVTIIYQSASGGALIFDYKAIIAAAIAGGCGYLIKNVFTGSGGQILTNNPPSPPADKK